MNSSEPSLKIHLRIYFSFYFRNFSLPHTLEKCEGLKNELKRKEENFTIDLHFGENWEDPPLVRRFLFSSNPHLHYRREIEKEEWEKIQFLSKFRDKFLKDSSKISIEISIVQGGSGIARLKIDNLEIPGNEKNSFFETLKSFTEETIHGNAKSFDTLFFLNKFFVKEIRKLLINILQQTTEELKKVEWNEFARKRDKEISAEYIIGIGESAGGFKYVSIESIEESIEKSIEPKESSNGNFLYQQPYLVCYSPYPKKLEKIKVINAYFGGLPLLSSERIFRKISNQESFEETLKEEGIKKLVIKIKDEEKKDKKKKDKKKKDIKDIAEIYIDPTKILIFTKMEEQYIQEIDSVIHRALFFARTIMHYYILWDTRLQITFQEIYETLKKVEEAQQQQNLNSLFKHLEELTKIEFDFAKDEAELYNSFIWRYSSFLPSKLGYLSVLYNLMEELFDIRDKMENLRNSIRELMDLLQFTGDLIRGFIAPKLPELLRKVDRR